MFRLIIAGSRSFNDYDTLRAVANALLRNKTEVTIVSGTARGADQLGEQYAVEHGYELARYPAEWHLHGKAAGYVRNTQMAQNADALLAFWDGKSRGTMHMISIANRDDLPVRVFNFNTNRFE